MPFYDRKCSACDWQKIDVFERVTPEDVSCPDCSAATDRVWLTKPSNVIGDECDIRQENGFKTVQHFRSKIERKRALKAAGVEECVQHRPMPGTDKSKHTMNWATMDSKTLENARILVERQGGFKGNDPAPDVRMRITHVKGDGIGRY
jgi:hypothetical protein